MFYMACFRANGESELNMAPVSYLIGLASFTLYIVLFLLVGRLKFPVGWLVLEVVLGGVSFILGATSGFLLIHNFSIWYALSLFGFCWYCFFFVSGIFYVSVSVGLIHYLNRQPSKSALVEELYKECVEKPFFNRVEFMVQTGMVNQSPQGYLISKNGISTVKRILSLQKLLKLESRGYYSSDLTKGS
jgi:hypothetical protein